MTSQIYGDAESLHEKVKSSPNVLRLCFLVLVLGLAFVLRLMYVRRIGLFVDEYISILAMQSIVKYGVPILPSGLFYGPKALLHSYVGALTFWMFGPSEFAIRFLSILAGVAAVAFIYKVGRNWFSSIVGLSAAVALAWLPSAIEWSGRARMYSLFQLLSLIGGYLLIDGYLVSPNRKTRVLGIFIMLLAVFVHPLALIVLGGVIVGVGTFLLVSLSKLKPKPKLSPSFWEILASVIFIGAVVILNPMGGPWGVQVRLSDMAQGSLNIQERVFYLVAFIHQFVTWPLWPLTIFYALGFISLFFRRAKKFPLPGDRVAWSLYILILFAWLATSILSRLHDDRYLFAILPFFLLLAIREFYLFTGIILTAIKSSFLQPGVLGISGVISIFIIALFAPGVVRLVSEDTFGFVSAYLYVQDHWQVGDVIATCSPAPSHLVLGRTDYYVIQYGAESDNGVDVWTGAPLIDTQEEFQAVLENNPRLWFVVEKLCWERHFDVDFQKAVNRNMQITLDYKGMLVFVSNRDRTK